MYQCLANRLFAFAEGHLQPLTILPVFLVLRGSGRLLPLVFLALRGSMLCMCFLDLRGSLRYSPVCVYKGAVDLCSRRTVCLSFS